MGWTFRKSIRIGGGVRLNLSSKGIGISGGVKGARISFGPNGTRISGGVGPFRYQKSVSLNGKTVAKRRLTSKERRALDTAIALAPFEIHRPVPIQYYFLGGGIFFSILAVNTLWFFIFAFPLFAVFYRFRNGTAEMTGWNYFKESEKRNTFEEKLPLLNEAAFLYPVPGIRLFRVEAFLETGQAKEVIDEALTLANSFPNPVTIFLLSKCLVATEQWKEALKWLENIDEPKQWDERVAKCFIIAVGLKAECYFGLKEFDKALTVLQIGLSKRKEEYVEYQRDLRVIKAKVLLASGKRGLAQKEIQRLLAESPNHSKGLAFFDKMKAAS